MAVSCPRCGNLIDQEFGVAACLHCQAILFINMDGHAQITEDLANKDEESDSLPHQPPEVPAFDHDPTADHVDPMQPQGHDSRTTSGMPVPAPPLPETSNGTGVYESSEQVLGAISYSIKIENIDTKEIRYLMIEALDDAKFQWDAREVLHTLKNGTLELKNLNPVKASVVVQRLRELPVKVSWKQNVYS